MLTTYFIASDKDICLIKTSLHLGLSDFIMLSSAIPQIICNQYIHLFPKSRILIFQNFTCSTHLKTTKHFMYVNITYNEH